MGVNEVNTQNGIFKKIPNHVYLVVDIPFSNLYLEVTSSGNMKGLATGSMARAN